MALGKTVQISTKALKVGDYFHLSTLSLSEDEIIIYAKEHDPLDFHIDRAAAEKSAFKGIIACGTHVFNKIHKENWIPLFGHTVICGIEVNHWKFLKPIYPEQTIVTSATITGMKINREKNHVVIDWLYEFKNSEDELFQRLDMAIMHHLV